MIYLKAILYSYIRNQIFQQMETEAKSEAIALRYRRHSNASQTVKTKNQLISQRTEKVNVIKQGGHAFVLYCIVVYLVFFFYTKIFLYY